MPTTNPTTVAAAAIARALAPHKKQLEAVLADEAAALAKAAPHSAATREARLAALETAASANAADLAELVNAGGRAGWLARDAEIEAVHARMAATKAAPAAPILESFAVDLRREIDAAQAELQARWDAVCEEWGQPISPHPLAREVARPVDAVENLLIAFIRPGHFEALGWRLKSLGLV